MPHELERLIASGQVKVGDELYHPVRQSKGELIARIVDPGVEVQGKRYRSVSTAAKSVVRVQPRCM